MQLGRHLRVLRPRQVAKTVAAVATGGGEGPCNWGGTCGSFVHAMTVSFGMPLSSMALPKASVSSVAPSQLSRSHIASNGEADACTPASVGGRNGAVGGR